MDWYRNLNRLDRIEVDELYEKAEAFDKLVELVDAVIRSNGLGYSIQKRHTEVLVDGEKLKKLADFLIEIGEVDSEDEM